MEIFDINNNLIPQEEYNFSMGLLQEETIVVAEHPAQEYIKEEGHYEVIREYANGGREVKWVVDVPGQKAREAWTEYKTILRLIPFTDKQKAELEIDDLKEKLLATDYNILKVMEGAATLSEMREVIAERAAWRERINELQVLYNI